MDRSSILRASTIRYRQVGKRTYLLFITYRYRGESNSVQGAGVKKTPRQRGVGRAFLIVVQRKTRPRISAQTGTCFPDDASSGNCDPESSRRTGYAFPMTPQAETATRNRRPDWDSFSGWVVGGNCDPEFALRTGYAFSMAIQAESVSRNPASNWDTPSAPPPQLQNLRALHPKTG